MCGLFGFSVYGKKPVKDLMNITDSLSKESADRGTDAVGIAYHKGEHIKIMKENKPAYSVQFCHPDTVKTLIGHTRHATQGKADKNYNNHPFFGATEHNRFALAHNGIIFNDEELKRAFNLPSSKIETDSYVAVQLLEQHKSLTSKTIADMAEKIEGSYSFSILDDHDRLYLVKGDSPLSVLKFPREQMYVYASTDEILWRAIINTSLFKSVKAGAFEPVEMKQGDILTIEPDGCIKTTAFTMKERRHIGTYPYSYYSGFYCGEAEDGYNEYLEELRAFAKSEGIKSEYVDMLADLGYAPEDIEEYLYTECGVEM